MPVKQPPFPPMPEQNEPATTPGLNPNNQFSRMRLGGSNKVSQHGPQSTYPDNTAPPPFFNGGTGQPFQPAPASTNFAGPNDATAQFSPSTSLFNPGNQSGAPGQFGGAPGQFGGAPGQFDAGPSATLNNPNGPDPTVNALTANNQPRTQQFDGMNNGPFAQPGPGGAPPWQTGNPTGMLPENTATGTLMPPVGEYSGNTGMLTLNQAVKIVKIPVAGRPGEFKTGILPVMAQPSTGALPPPAQNNARPGRTQKNKAILLIALVLLVLVGSGSYLLLHAGASTPSTTNTNQPGGNASSAASKSASATAYAQATATYINNHLIVQDPLSYNGHNWPVANSSGRVYSFKDGAYHIRQNGSFLAYTLMANQTLPASYTYNLTMQSVSSDPTQGNLSFYCMIMNYKDYGGGKVSFYMFRVNNVDSAGNPNISYEFDKYDNRQGSDGAYQEIFPDNNNTPGDGKGTSHEFLGPHQANQYTVADQKGNFTFLVNGTKIGTAKDTTFSGGGVGMGVSQQGTETAFTNLSLLNN